MTKKFFALCALVFLGVTSSAAIAGFSGPSAGSGGTVTTVSVVSANGFAGTVNTPTTTPAITLSTNVVAGMVKSNGTALQQATAGTDYAAANASTTVNTQTCTLGGSCTVTAAPSGSAGGVLSGTYPNPGINLTVFSSVANSDTSLNSTSTTFNVVNVAQGTSGTWLTCAGTTYSNSSGFGNIIYSLSDGTTTFASGLTNTQGLSNPTSEGIMLCGLLSSPAGNIRFNVRDSNSTNGKAAYNASGLSNDTWIRAVRIQ